MASITVRAAFVGVIGLVLVLLYAMDTTDAMSSADAAAHHGQQQQQQQEVVLDANGNMHRTIKTIEASDVPPFSSLENDEDGSGGEKMKKKQSRGCSAYDLTCDSGGGGGIAYDLDGAAIATETMTTMTTTTTTATTTGGGGGASAPGTPTRDAIECIDEHEECGFWAEIGECQKNPTYMLHHCRKSCKTCSTTKNNKKQNKNVNKQQQQRNRRDMKELVKERPDDGRTETPETRFGVRQRVEGDEAEDTLAVLWDSVEYMEDVVFTDPQYTTVKDKCQNKHDLCAFWAALGECKNNAGFMTTNCAPSCKSCHLLDIETRCPFDREVYKDAYDKGDMHDMFQSLMDPLSEYATNYGPLVVHSRPEPTMQDKYILPPGHATNYQTGPWVITFDNFLSEEECDRLIELGYEEGYKRSTDVGEEKFDGTFDDVQRESRTSTNAWCMEECEKDPVSIRVMERISNVTRVPVTNAESFQILKYVKGQKYDAHHDYIPHQKERWCGPRILTFFLYLSDVEAGGGTHFPLLDDLTIMPKKGKALLWPSVVDEDPSSPDYRTRHAALKVEEGVKYAANAWIHLRDFTAANNQGCT